MEQKVGLRRILVALSLTFSMVQPIFPSDGSRFEKAVKINTIEAYQRYLTKFPQGKHAEEADRAIDDLIFQEVRERDTRWAYEGYVRSHPDGGHVDEAGKAIEKLEFEKRKAAGSTHALKSFLQEYPDGAYASEARKLIEDLDLATAKKQDSRQTYKAFLNVHPDSAFAEEAKRRIDELDFEEAQSTATIGGYSRYLEEQPEGAFVERAVAERTRLENDLESFRRAYAVYSKSSFAAYLQDHPKGKHVTEAEKALEVLQRIDEIEASFSRRPSAFRRVGLEDDVPAFIGTVSELPRVEVSEEALESLDSVNLYASFDPEKNKGRHGLLDMLNVMIGIRDADLASSLEAAGLAVSEDSLQRYFVVIDFHGYSVDMRQGHTTQYDISVPMTTNSRIRADVAIVDSEKPAVIYSTSVLARGSYRDSVLKNSGFATAKSQEANTKMFERLLKTISKLRFRTSE